MHELQVMTAQKWLHIVSSGCGSPRRHAGQAPERLPEALREALPRGPDYLSIEKSQASSTDQAIRQLTCARRTCAKANVPLRKPHNRGPREQTMLPAI